MIDVVIWGIMGTLLCPVIALSFKSKIVSRENYRPVVLSCIIVVILVLGDLSVPFWYTTRYEDAPAIRQVLKQNYRQISR